MNICPSCKNPVFILNRICPSCRHILSDVELTSLGLDPKEHGPAPKHEPTGRELSGQIDEDAQRRASRSKIGKLMILAWIVGRIGAIASMQNAFGKDTEALKKFAISSTFSPMLLLPIIGLLLILSSRRKS